VAQQIEKQNTHTLSRIMSCQAVPELGNISRVGPTGNSRMPTYTSPLRNIHRRYKDKNPTNVHTTETIPPFVVLPWWRGPVTHIEQETDAHSTHDRKIRKGGKLYASTQTAAVSAAMLVQQQYISRKDR
jgi:hypothetical protein